MKRGFYGGGQELVLYLHLRWLLNLFSEASKLFFGLSRRQAGARLASDCLEDNKCDFLSDYILMMVLFVVAPIMLPPRFTLAPDSSVKNFRVQHIRKKWIFLERGSGSMRFFGCQHKLWPFFSFRPTRTIPILRCYVAPEKEKKYRLPVPWSLFDS